VLSTTHPVVWAAGNVWQLTGTEGSSADTAFVAKYGWDPSQSYFDTTDDPAALRQFADYLYSQHVPFSVGVIPEYTDPNGYYNGGKKQTITLAQEPTLVAALKYMQSKGGTIIEHGFTHQYSNVANPYNGVTGRLLFAQAGLSQPAIWETPHYFASAADYMGIGTVYSTRYEREIFPSGLLGGSLDCTHIFGQFFPYVVHDAYGEKVIPENLGNYEPAETNNNLPRLPADIIHNAQVNLAVTQGVASFFFHPTYPLSDLQQIVAGIKALGYTFVSPTGLPG
jgi:uncharacterized protein YdaL